MPAKPRKNTVAPRTLHPEVSGRWLVKALGLLIVAAAACGWLTLCLLFWQGSWQLLYHPKRAVTSTPRDIGLTYDSIDFNAGQNGESQLRGWWIPSSPGSRFTFVYLHGADGNLGDFVQELIPLRASSVNIFAFDYRGYGMSQWSRPSEDTLRADAESALRYLEDTRHIPAEQLILSGSGLGANLAVEVAAAHPQIAGVVADRPLYDPAEAIFSDPRAMLVPARWLVNDRYDTPTAAHALKVPSLWFYERSPQLPGAPSAKPQAFQMASGSKMVVWISNAEDTPGTEAASLKSWLYDLPPRGSDH
jgi:hypothetical protein